jgi:hypothetical protein
MGYGQIEGAIPGDCMAPQNWAWWTEHTQWEAGAVARGRANWQRPKMTPTVRPPFGTMPRPQSLRRHAEEMAAATAALTASAAPSSQGTILGSSRVSSAAATSAAAASPRMRSVSLTPLATPRTLQQLNDARAEIGRYDAPCVRRPPAHAHSCMATSVALRPQPSPLCPVHRLFTLVLRSHLWHPWSIHRLAELKSAREEIAALRAALAQSGVAAALPPGPPPGSSSRRLLSAVSQTWEQHRRCHRGERDA